MSQAQQSQVAPRGGKWAAPARKLARPAAKPVRAVMSAAETAACGTRQAAAKVQGKTTTDIVAGGLARAASQSTIHPLDTVKTRQQVSGAVAAGAAASGAAAGGAARVAAQVRSLYRGVGGAALGAGIAVGSYFAFYGATMRLLQDKTDLPLVTIALVAGAAGALGSSLLKVPASVLIRSVQANVYPNVCSAAREIVRKAGVRGLFTGYLPTLIEDVPDMAVKFATYESLRQAHEVFTGRSREEAHKLEDLAMGGVAGAMAAAATTPLDVIKTRMMVCAGSGRQTLLGAAAAVLREGGPRGLLVGCGARTVSNFINSGIFFVFFESLRTALARFESRAEAPLEAAPAAEEPQAPPPPVYTAAREEPGEAIGCAGGHDADDDADEEGEVPFLAIGLSAAHE